MRRLRALALATGVAAVGAAVVALGGGVTLRSPGGDSAPGSPRFQPQPVTAMALPPGHGHLTAWLRRRVAVRARPGGRRVGRLRTGTTWGTPRILSVAKVRGRWLGVRTEVRPNRRLGWIPASATRLRSVREKLVADLSRRRLTLFRDGRRRRSVRVAIGRPGNPTPKGRFAITDVLSVRGESPYGCCVIALSGRQPKLPAGWPGGDRLAIHSTSGPARVGTAESIGCLRARTRDMRWLFRRAPQPGTPVVIKR